MKSLFSLLPVLMIILASCTMQTSAQTKEERNIADSFTKIEASSGVDVFVKQGEQQEIIVEAKEDRLENVKTELKNNTLRVYISNGNLFSWFNQQSAKVYVTTKDITKLSASGGADIKTIGEVETEEIEISASGGADVDATINATKVILRCSGGGDISVVGATNHLEAHASGGADIEAKQLTAQKVVASASGGGDVEVYASEEIDASASGGADVDYYGPGKIINISESGGGDVTGH